MIRFIKSNFIKNKKIALIAYYGVVVFILFISIFKDICYTQPVPADLRNRVVGSRMIKDGKSPYFYKWRPGEPTRYYDYSFSGFVVSGVTSSPFFNNVFGIIADMPQYQLTIAWIFIEYFSLLGCFVLVVFSQKNKHRRYTFPLIVALTVAFTFTIGWRVHVFSGQNYIFIPLLAMCCYYVMTKGNKLSYILFAVFAVMLILIRPTACLFFVPFLFYFKTYFKWGIASLLVISGYFLFVFFSPLQKTNWTDYFKSLQIHANLHQGIYNNKLDTAFCHLILEHLEGVDLETGSNKKSIDKFSSIAECSNLYIIYKAFTGKPISIKAMTMVGFITAAIILLPLFWFKKNELPIPTSMLFILGFIVYDIISFCTPIMRPNYCWVEFLFPLQLIAVNMKKVNLIPIFFLIIGLYLNIAAPIYIPIRQNLGELLIIIALLCQAYRPFLFAFLNEAKWKVNENVYWL